MKQRYNLSKIFTLDAMHDQRINQISIDLNKLILQFNNLVFYKPYDGASKNYYDSHVRFHSCDMEFIDVDDAYAEIRIEDSLSVKGQIYYIQEFIEYINKNRKIVEVINIFSGYETVFIQGALLNENGYYCETCWLKISAKEVVYRWN